MAWRVARSLDVLLSEINNRAPNRNKASDGSIGDAAHATRSSDHNPWVKIGSMGIVTARDFTHDPAHGLNCHDLAAHLVARARAGDRRIKYIIWDRKISNPSVSNGAWRAYNGSNPHTKHLHLSVSSQAIHFDSTTPWGWNGSQVYTLGARILREGVSGPKDVFELQGMLNQTNFTAPIPQDDDFGPLTTRAVKDCQNRLRVPVDGEVGPITLGALREVVAAPPKFYPIGEIKKKYEQLGAFNSDLGMPLTNEIVTPDQRGRFTKFANGAIYWTPETGAHEVRGDIYRAWSKLGWETGLLGYPVSDEEDHPAGQISKFQRGSLLWDEKTRKITLTAELR